MKVKTSELTGAALDWAVLEATGFFKGYTQFRSGKNFLKVYGVARSKHLHPSTDWSQGGPIMYREGIGVMRIKNRQAHQQWAAGEHDDESQDRFWEVVCGPTPLIAAMRCYVMSELGDEVDVPEELK